MNISHSASVESSVAPKAVKLVPLSCYCKLDDLIPHVKQLTQPAPTPPDNSAKNAA
ncbi:hypothetical protein [Hymenobacter cavernae]|uniref:Uncharacterized protein n=1 Tax=Hymenobacter cavernae TaxID=2044852 RepID=A0ABQ1UC90_9BACT|nr:hypothetical protein [Hymenobacter cavernae]GGF14571.1 hypothetical protein GCM10011383_27240 [Hymenobacter cavernae]